MNIHRGSRRRVAVSGGVIVKSRLVQWGPSGDLVRDPMIDHACCDWNSTRSTRAVMKACRLQVITQVVV